MISKTEKLRSLRDKKQARIKTLQQEVDALNKRVQVEENMEIITTVRSLCLGPEELQRLLLELRNPNTVPDTHIDDNAEHNDEEENDDE